MSVSQTIQHKTVCSFVAIQIGKYFQEMDLHRAYTGNIPVSAQGLFTPMSTHFNQKEQRGTSESEDTKQLMSACIMQDLLVLANVGLQHQHQLHNYDDQVIFCRRICASTVSDHRMFCTY